MTENPIMILAYLGIAGYVLNMYRGDLKSACSGQPGASPMLGATPFGWKVSLIAVLGSLLLLGAETGGSWPWESRLSRARWSGTWYSRRWLRAWWRR